MEKLIKFFRRAWYYIYPAAAFPKVVKVYNLAENRAYFLYPRKLGCKVRREFASYGMDLKNVPIPYYIQPGDQGALPEDRHRDVHFTGSAAQIIWALCKAHGQTTYYSRPISLPPDPHSRDCLQQILLKERQIDLLAFDRTGIAPLPIEIIIGTAYLYGQIISSNKRKRQRAQEAKDWFDRRLAVYRRIKARMFQCGFQEPEQFYRKVRRDYEFLRNIAIRLNVVANRIAEIKKAANENMKDEIQHRHNALKPWALLKGKNFFRGTMVISSFLLGGGAATYMLSVKDELLAYFKSVTSFPTTVYVLLILAAGALALLGQTLFDVLVKRIERSIWQRTALRLHEIEISEHQRINIELRKLHLYVYEQMAKYHYIEDLERNAPQYFVHLARSGQWEAIAHLIRRAEAYMQGSWWTRLFTPAHIRHLANVRPY